MHHFLDGVVITAAFVTFVDDCWQIYINQTQAVRIQQLTDEILLMKIPLAIHNLYSDPTYEAVRKNLFYSQINL